MLYTEKLLYQNSNGEVINIGYDYDLIPLEFEDEVDNEINTSKFALQHGSTFVSSTLSDRTISIRFTYAIRNAIAIENEVLRVVNPTLEATLYKINSFEEKFIKVRPLGKPQITRMQGRGEIVIDLKACEPFYQTTNVIEKLANQTPMARFPMYWVTDEQKVLGKQVSVLNTEIINKGDVSTGFEVVFKANGSVTNPSLINNANNNAIRLNLTLGQGDEVRIINMPYSKQVIVNGVKQFAALDRVNSNFFDLEVGLNSFKVEADENVVNLSTYIQYAPKFL